MSSSTLTTLDGGEARGYTVAPRIELATAEHLCLQNTPPGRIISGHLFPMGGWQSQLSRRVASWAILLRTFPSSSWKLSRRRRLNTFCLSVIPLPPTGHRDHAQRLLLHNSATARIKIAWQQHWAQEGFEASLRIFSSISFLFCRSPKWHWYPNIQRKSSFLIPWVTQSLQLRHGVCKFVCLPNPSLYGYAIQFARFPPMFNSIFFTSVAGKDVPVLCAEIAVL